MLLRHPSALLLIALAALAAGTARGEDPRPRARDLGIAPGEQRPGALNAITDVPGVAVGHVTLIDGERFCTGATAIVPHPGNIFQEKVPAAVAVANGFGKLVGFTQVEELGQLETPILLTNTLGVWDAAAALVAQTLAAPGNDAVRSVNPVVGETNDGWLNDIRSRPLKAEHFFEALRAARGGKVAEGCVGAGAGTINFGFKGGIGTSSRRANVRGQVYFVGALVQTNFGGRLTIDGAPVWRELAAESSADAVPPNKDGSCMIVLATDAPVDARQLKRLARRTFAGMARTGANFAHGSGDYAIAFSTAEEVRIPAQSNSATRQTVSVDEAALTPLFEAAADATEEAIYNALLAAVTTRGRDGHVVEAIPIDRLRRTLDKFGRGSGTGE